MGKILTIDELGDSPLNLVSLDDLLRFYYARHPDFPNKETVTSKKFKPQKDEHLDNPTFDSIKIAFDNIQDQHELDRVNMKLSSLTKRQLFISINQGYKYSHDLDFENGWDFRSIIKDNILPNPKATYQLIDFIVGRGYKTDGIFWFSSIGTKLFETYPLNDLTDIMKKKLFLPQYSNPRKARDFFEYNFFDVDLNFLNSFSTYINILGYFPPKEISLFEDRSDYMTLDVINESIQMPIFQKYLKFLSKIPIEFHKMRNELVNGYKSCLLEQELRKINEVVDSLGMPIYLREASYNAAKDYIEEGRLNFMKKYANQLQLLKND